MSIEYEMYGHIASSSITDSYSFNSASFELDGTVSIGNYTGTSLIGALNGAADYYTLRGYSHWALNKDKRSIEFTINNTKRSFTMNSQIILFLDLASEGSICFDGWYRDADCTVALENYLIESDDETSLYGRLSEDTNNYTISFDTRGGTSVPSNTGQFGNIISLPTNTERNDCKFQFWETEYEDQVPTGDFTIPVHNITLYAVWLCTHITTAEDLVAFSKVVNSGTNYEGTTVFLDNDIDFTEVLPDRFEPIGKNENNYFRGTFDGQGHAIRNLAINSSNKLAVGLFEYSSGIIIKNVVIDGTCSVVSNYASTGSQAYTGSIIGCCISFERTCNIENSVNMANITFSGNAGDFSYTGGIAGLFISENYEASIKNCVNYGTVKGIGASGETSIGGIVGVITSFSSSYNYIQNCFYYGTIIFNGTTGQLFIGGISGYNKYNNLDNCVSSGFIAVIPSSIKDKYVGCIVGYAEYSSFSHCYWDMSIKYAVYGFFYSSSITDSYSFNSASFELGGTVSIGNYTGTPLIGALNGAAGYYTLRGYSHWALNKDMRSIEFTINNRNNPFTTDSQIILLPSLASEGSIVFDGWYRDADCTVALDDYLIESDDETSLHGRWAGGSNNYTISFDTRGGTSVSSITGQFGTTVKLTEKPTKKYCKFQLWETEYGYQISTIDFTILAQNITLYAVWLCTNITTAEDLVALSKIMNYYEISCKGNTVILNSDIDFSEALSAQFEPIGKDGVNYFRGTFDGQGHVIRNLTINLPSQYAGLFGYSTGTTIKNVVIDTTCNVASNFALAAYQAFTGSIIGYCISIEGACTIENSVNMADVIFNGKTKSISFMGGIAGVLGLIGYKVSVKNSVNYGTVKGIGASGTSSIGGIVGRSIKSSSSSTTSYMNIQNCLNYGTVLFNGTSNEIRIGGISGYSQYNNFDNCVSSGYIVVPSSIENKYVGSISGAAEYSSITHCYWIKDAECDKSVGYSDESTITNIYYVEQFNATALNELNEYADEKGLSKWFMLHLNGGRINNITQSELVEFQSHIPVPVRENNTFLRWYKDAECNEVYDNDASGVTDLYAVWDTVYVTFLFENGTVVGPVGVKYGGKYESLPETGVERHTFCGWYTSEGGEGIGGKVITNETNVTTSNDHTLHGCWTKNKYTVTFDLGNGTVIEETYYYNDKINKPSSVEREGCIFYGWDNKTEFMPSQSITITALWNCTQSSSSITSSSSSTKEIIDEGKSKSSSNTGAIVGGVIGSILVVAVISLVVLFLLFYKKKEGTMKRRRDNVEMEANNPRIVEIFNAPVNTPLSLSSSSVSDSIAKFYPGYYKIPTIAEALRMAGLDEGRVSDAVEACTSAGHYASKEGKLTDAFAKEDAAAVALYTFDFGGDDFESNPYRIINKALTSGRDEDLQRASGLLYVVMCALRKLPRSTGSTLYRGVRAGVDMEQYKEGSTVVWRGLSSTSPDMGSTKAFLASNTANGKAEGTLFVIDGGWGYDIQPYSLFPDEAEILLEPEREFRVQDVIEADMTVVRLQMLDTPLILPQVFGENVN